MGFKLNISSIVENNSLFNINNGCSLDAAIDNLHHPYIIEKNYKRKETYILMDDNKVQLFFDSNYFTFGLIWIQYDNEVICLNETLNYSTLSSQFCNLLEKNKIPYSQDELIKKDQLNINLDNFANFIFAYEGHSYKLNKIIWGKSRVD